MFVFVGAEKLQNILWRFANIVKHFITKSSKPMRGGMCKADKPKMLV